jgi:histidine phosphotransfer protein HptB
MTINSPINLEYLHQISDGDTEFELELLNLFIEDARLHLEAAKLAVKAADFHNLEREAHHLKGSSGNVGAQAMQAIAQTLEQQALKNSLEDVPAQIIALETYLKEVEGFTNTYTSTV